MHNKIALIFIIFTSICCEAKSTKLPYISMDSSLLEKISNNYILSNSVVKNFKKNKKQSLDFTIIGMHKKNCSFALAKLSLYEEFHSFIGMVKKSTYNNKNNQINLYLSHSLLPFRMTLKFKIPRITQAGDYTFYFDKGFLKGLKGLIQVRKHGKRCLFKTTANWKGKDTGFSSVFFEFFSSAAAKHVMQILFRVSSTY